MSHSSLFIFNLLLQSYQTVSLNQLFLNSIQIEIITVSKSYTFQALKELGVPKQQSVQFKGLSTTIFKLHNNYPIQKLEKIFQYHGILITKNGYFLTYNSNRSKLLSESIQCIIIPSTNVLKDEQIDIYTSMIQPFFKHLAIKILKYQSNTILPFVNMFQNLEVLPDNTFFKIFDQVPFRSTLKDYSRSSGQYYCCEYFQCWYCISEENISQIDTLLNNLPILNSSFTFPHSTVINKNYKYFSQNSSIGRHFLVGKQNIRNKMRNKNRMEQSVGNFNCVMNFKTLKYESLQKQINVFFEQMMRQLLLMGMLNYRSQLMAQNHEDIKLISKLLQIDEISLINKLIL